MLVCEDPGPCARLLPPTFSRCPVLDIKSWPSGSRFPAQQELDSVAARPAEIQSVLIRTHERSWSRIRRLHLLLPEPRCEPHV